MYRRTLLSVAALSLAALLPGCVGFDFSPDGRQVVVSTSAGLSVFNVDGSGRQNLPGTNGGTLPSWSPDGKRVLYASHNADTGDHLMLFDLTTRKTRQLAKEFGPPFAWREDGRRFVACGKREDGKAEAIWYDAAEGGITLRVTLPAEPAGDVRMVWLPGTDDIAYMGGENEKVDVYTVEAGEGHKITTSSDVIGLALSADKKKLVWARRGPNLKYLLMSIYSWDITSRSAKRLSFPDRVPLLNPDPRHAPSSIPYVSFAPDGSHLALIATLEATPASDGKQRESTACYVMGIDGGGAKLVQKLPPTAGNESALYPSWSRDGKRFGVLALLQKRIVLTLYNADGGAPVRVLDEKTE